MTGRIPIITPRAAREIAALIVVAELDLARAVIEARKKTEYEAARTIALTGQIHGLVEGQTMEFGGETYRVTSIGQDPGVAAVFEHLAVRSQVIEPERTVRPFRSDRPYLKKKKGRS